MSDANNPGATNLTPDAGGGPDLGGGETLTSKPRQMPAGGGSGPDAPSGSPGMDQMDQASGDAASTDSSTDTSTAVPNGTDNGAPEPSTKDTT